MLNKVMLIGNLGADPEVRGRESGHYLLSLRLAVTEKFKNSDGEPQERTEWINCIWFGERAERVEQYLYKGQKVYVEGKFTTREWEDKEGVKRRTSEVKVWDLQMLDSKGDRQSSKPQGGSPSEDDIPF